jgi:hypothetical protein
MKIVKQDEFIAVHVMKCYTGGRGITLLILDLGTSWK